MRRTRIAFAAVLTLSLTLVTAAQTPPAPLPPPGAAQAASPVITVRSTGTGPKRAVRYRATAGARDRIEVSMKMTIGVDVPEVGPQHVEAPPVRIVMDIDVEDVAPNGDITSRMEMVSASMEGPGVPAGVLDALKGLSGAMVISDRGLVKSVAFDTSTIGNPAIGQVLSSMGFDRLTTPMPEEAVGVGATWEVVQTLDAGGMQMHQKSVYELVAMDATSMTFEVAMEQTAPPQKMAPPGLPMEASLVSMAGESRGRMTLPDGALALFGELTARSRVVMDLVADGTSRRMSTTTGLTMSITRGER